MRALQHCTRFTIDGVTITVYEQTDIVSHHGRGAMVVSARREPVRVLVGRGGRPLAVHPIGAVRPAHGGVHS